VVESRAGVLFNKTFLRFPIAISTVLTCVRYGVADGLVQISEIRNEIRSDNWDYPRSAAFCLFGLYCGLFYGKLYSTWYEMLMARLLRANISKISAGFGIAVVDSTLFAVITYFPVYYTIQEFCHSRRFVPVLGLRLTWRNKITDMKAMLFFYGPILTLNLLFVPVHLRAISINIGSNIWAIFLSKMRGKYKPISE